MTPRVGIGYDVHALVAGRPLVLCGVEVAHPRGLAGHSDGDAGTHALIDAVLGALGLDDLGAHFPAEPEWHGADSIGLLADVAARAVRAGYRVGNADVTVVAHAPRLAPHRDAMRARLAAALQVAPRDVSVKFTSSDGLGVVGREEGVAAVATVLLAPYQPDRSA